MKPRSNLPVQDDHCQIHGLPDMAEPLTLADHLVYFLHRLKRITKRRVWFLRNWMGGSRPAAALPPAGHGPGDAGPYCFQAGDRVRIKSREQIRATLDNWNQLKGCAFTEEMWAFCGSRHRVLKRVNRFLDERDYRLKRCRGIVLLEGAICEGTRDFGPCDRSCFYFWRDEWLEKI